MLEILMFLNKMKYPFYNFLYLQNTYIYLGMFLPFNDSVEYFYSGSQYTDRVGRILSLISTQHRLNSLRIGYNDRPFFSTEFSWQPVDTFSLFW